MNVQPKNQTPPLPEGHPHFLVFTTTRDSQWQEAVSAWLSPSICEGDDGAEGDESDPPRGRAVLTDYLIRYLENPFESHDSKYHRTLPMTWWMSTKQDDEQPSLQAVGVYSTPFGDGDSETKGHIWCTGDTLPEPACDEERAVYSTSATRRALSTRIKDSLWALASEEKTRPRLRNALLAMQAYGGSEEFVERAVDIAEGQAYPSSGLPQ